MSLDSGTASSATPARYLLPREAYLSQAWFDREQELLFGRVWTFIGLESDCAEQGSYITGQLGPHPVFAIRGADGELRGFYNICRHRGAQLLEGKGRVERGVTCFYHRWTYTLDGALRAVPQQDAFPCLEKDRLGLRRAACATWNGLVFMHAQEHPPQSLADWLGEFCRGHGPWRVPDLQLALFQTHEVKANWKLYMENHVDGLHLFHLHGRSIKGLDHARQVWHSTGPHYTLREPPDGSGVLPERAMKDSQALPPIPGVGAEHRGSTVHMVFPNVGMAGGATFYVLIKIVPLAPDRTRVETWAFTAPLDIKQLALHPSLLWQMLRRPPEVFVPKVNPSNPDGDFVGEDVYAAESLQRSQRSSSFEVGPMAPRFEASIEVFHRNLLEYLGHAA
jgi:phenylpropionate dioxygenase-like ring-hydroxylating dioxygenase large terminal subunit